MSNPDYPPDPMRTVAGPIERADPASRPLQGAISSSEPVVSSSAPASNTPDPVTAWIADKRLLLAQGWAKGTETRDALITALDMLEAAREVIQAPTGADNDFARGIQFEDAAVEDALRKVVDRQ